MKKNALIISVLLTIATIAWATERVWINQNNRISLGMPLSMADNITLSDDGTTVNFNFNNNAGTHSCSYSDIKNVTFGEKQNTVIIAFDGTDADVVNPYAFEGVEVSKNGGNITIASTNTKKLRYEILGTTTDGSVTISSNTDFTLILNGANITNSTGSAINITSSSAATIELKDGTTSTLVDGTSGANGCLYSKGALTFSGEGTINVTGNTKQAIASKKDIIINSGNINVLSAKSDGLHSGTTFVMNGGTVKTQSTGGDGIDGDEGTLEINNGTLDIEVATADTKGIKADDTITINGGNININMPADQGKAFKTKSSMTVNGGTITTVASGNVVVVDNDPSYCTIIKTDGDFFMTGGNIEITSTGEAGKGFSIDGNAKFTGGNVKVTVSGGGKTYTNTEGATDSYSATCIKVDGNLEIINGTFDLLSSGIGGKCISTDSDAIFGDATQGPTITAKTTGARFVEVQGTNEDNTDYANPKVIKADNNLTIHNGTLNISSTQNGGEGLESKNVMTINGGTIKINTVDDCINAANSIVINDGNLYCMATGNDAIDSNGTLIINGGTIFVSGANAPEGGFDCDMSNNFTITGGILIGIGGSNTTPATNNTQQATLIYSATLNQNQLFTITDNNGNHIISFLNPRTASSNGGNTPPGGGEGRPPGGGGGPGGSNGGTSILISTPEFVKGNSYKIYIDGAVTPGETFECITYKGTYSAGTLKTTTTLSTMVTNVR